MEDDIYIFDEKSKTRKKYTVAQIEEELMADSGSELSSDTSSDDEGEPNFETLPDNSTNEVSFEVLQNVEPELTYYELQNVQPESLVEEERTEMNLEDQFQTNVDICVPDPSNQGQNQLSNNLDLVTLNLSTSAQIYSNVNLPKTKERLPKRKNSKPIPKRQMCKQKNGPMKNSKKKLTNRQIAEKVYKWGKKPTRSKLHPRPVFQSPSGPTCIPDITCNEMAFFEIFFDEDTIKNIKTESNRYAASSIKVLILKNQLKDNSLWKQWSAITISEIYAFFSIVMHMMVVKKPMINDYWNHNNVLNTSFARSLMTRDRFKSILYVLHLNDNANYVSRNETGHDPLFKVRPIFDKFVQSSLNSWAPAECLCIDEGICPFRGRVSFRVYMKNKPERYGIKFYVLSDSSNGYIVNAEIYTAKVDATDNTVKAVVNRLLEPFFGKQHTVFMDRFYTSPEIAAHLLSKNTQRVGTFMPNRMGVPQDFANVRLGRGELTFVRSKNDIVLLKWKDKRDVFVLSTKHDPKFTEVKNSRSAKKEKIWKPECVVDYNMNKTGVDHSDQLASYYPFGRKTLKWWKKLFFHLYTLSMINAHILYKAKTGKKIPLQQFIQNVCQQFADKSGALGNPEGNNSNGSAGRLVGRHFIEKIPPTAKKQHPTRVCHVCKRKKLISSQGKIIRKETAFWCPECEIPLCLENCFKSFHTKVEYWK